MSPSSFKSFISQSRSKTHIKAIAIEVFDNPCLFKELITLMADKDTFIANNAAWAMSDIVEKDLKIVTPHLTELYAIAVSTRSDGIKRNILRVWQWVTIPENLQFDVADFCLSHFLNPKETVAIKAFSLTVLQNLLPAIPELKTEILFEIEKQMPHATPAFIYRAKKFISAANKL